MNEIKAIFSNPDVAAIVMGCMIPIVAIIAGVWGEVAKSRENNELKKDMLNRGMSAQEIEQVVNSGTKKAKRR